MDYLTTVKVQNNNILKLMKMKNIESVAEMCRLAGVCQSKIGEYINMRKSPLNSRGEFNPQIIKLAGFFSVVPECLFNDQQLYEPLESNISTKEMTQEQIESVMLMSGERHLLEGDSLEALEREQEVAQRDEQLNQLLTFLSPRHQYVIKKRFGIDCEAMTLKAIAQDMGLTQERIRQMEGKALRILRCPTHRLPTQKTSAKRDEIHKELREL